MPAVHPQDFSVMAVLQPQKVIHDSSHLWPMRSENKFLRILSLGRQLAASRSQKRSGVIILVTHHSEVGEPEVGFWEVAQPLPDCRRHGRRHRGWELCT